MAISLSGASDPIIQAAQKALKDNAKFISVTIDGVGKALLQTTETMTEGLRKNVKLVVEAMNKGDSVTFTSQHGQYVAPDKIQEGFEKRLGRNFITRFFSWIRDVFGGLFHKKVTVEEVMAKDAFKDMPTQALARGEQKGLAGEVKASSTAGTDLAKTYEGFNAAHGFQVRKVANSKEIAVLSQPDSGEFEEIARFVPTEDGTFKLSANQGKEQALTNDLWRSLVGWKKLGKRIEDVELPAIPGVLGSLRGKITLKVPTQAELERLQTTLTENPSYGRDKARTIVTQYKNAIAQFNATQLSRTQQVVTGFDTAGNELTTTMHVPNTVEIEQWKSGKLEKIHVPVLSDEAYAKAYDSVLNDPILTKRKGLISIQGVSDSAAAVREARDLYSVASTKTARAVLDEMQAQETLGGQLKVLKDNIKILEAEARDPIETYGKAIKYVRDQFPGGHMPGPGDLSAEMIQTTDETGTKTVAGYTDNLAVAANRARLDKAGQETVVNAQLAYIEKLINLMDKTEANRFSSVPHPVTGDPIPQKVSVVGVENPATITAANPDGDIYWYIRELGPDSFTASHKYWTEEELTTAKQLKQAWEGKNLADGLAA